MCGIIEVRNIGCDAAGLRGSFFLSGKCKINFIDNIASQYRVVRGVFAEVFEAVDRHENVCYILSGIFPINSLII